MKKKDIIVLGILFIILIIFCLIESLDEYSETLIINKDFYIKELVASNKTVLMDENGEYSDYIILYNDSDSNIELGDYYLSNKDTNEKQFKLNGILESKSELIIFLDGNNNENHANFKLKKDGEIISIINKDNLVINKIKYSFLDSDYALVYKDGKYETINKSKNKERNILINEIYYGDNSYIELYNNSDNDVNLENYSIKIDDNNYNLSGTLKSKNYYSIENIKIKNDIKIELYNFDELINEFYINKINYNNSIGLYNNELVYYKNNTKNNKNSNDYYLGYSVSPKFNNDGGYVDKGTKVELISDNKIYYTIDGSIPSIKSNLYKEPIVINKTTVIRAISVKDNYIESDIVSRTFFVERKSKLGVISISSNSDNFYSSKNGILTYGSNYKSNYPYKGANFWKDIEIPVSIDYYENNELGFSINCGLKIFGGYSRGEPQKSFAVLMKRKYGVTNITYPLFDEYNTNSRFVIRNGGQDFGYLKIKDAFIQQTIKDINIDIQDFKPVAVYINGSYYGMSNIREKVDTTYVENRYNTTDFTLIEGNNSVKSGSYKEYQDLLDYVSKHDQKTDEFYNYVDSIVDLDELCNFWISEIFYDQRDPMNQKYYKTKDGKWRWVFYDLDQGLYDYSYKTILWDLPFDPDASNQSYTINTTLMKNLIKNPKFRQLYLDNWAKLLRNNFNPDITIPQLNDIINLVDDEMKYHIKKWGNSSSGWYYLSSYNQWKNNISSFKSKLKTRYNLVINNAKSGLGMTNSEYTRFKNILEGENE